MIGDAVADAGNWLKDTGKKIIQGLIDGLKGAFQAVKDTLTGLTDLLPDWKGPAERDRRLLTRNGQLIIRGLVEGLESRYGDVRSSLAGLTEEVAATQFPALSANVSGALSEAGSSPSLGGDTYNITTPDPLAAAAEVARRQWLLGV